MTTGERSAVHGVTGSPIRPAVRRLVSILSFFLLAPAVLIGAGSGQWVVVVAIPLAIALGYVWRDHDVRSPARATASRDEAASPAG